MQKSEAVSNSFPGRFSLINYISGIFFDKTLCPVHSVPVIHHEVCQAVYRWSKNLFIYRVDVDVTKQQQLILLQVFLSLVHFQMKEGQAVQSKMRDM